MLATMMRKPLLLLILSIAACGMGSAEPLLFVSESGQFSSTDVADSLVAPNRIFSLSFAVDSDPTPVALSVTTDSFDVPVEAFSYDLNDVPVSVVPSEITFFTLGDGGLFNVTIGSGFTAEDFSFEGDQAFSGTTAAPVFAAGQYNVTGVTYSDPTNFDSPAAIGDVSISPAPEPSTLLLISCGLAAVMGRKFRKQ
jgi:hypothetical protein